VDTTKVAGRRTVHYNSFDELLADAERLAVTDTRTLGNWSLGQILTHLARAMDMMIDGPPFLFPAPLRLLTTLFMKKRMLSRSAPPGYQLPKRAKHMVPEPTTTAEGLELLRVAVLRIQSTSQRGPHPVFGKMGPGEWDQFQLRHCEMHMSFAVPAK
jgi:hypothetical protein